ncbi:MAG: ATP-binding protein, partial [Campylobacterota bacterium]|nr:ATP-binding protein [Campylobacterota bacterium]
IYKDMGLDIKKRLRGMKEFGDHYLAYSTAKIPPNIKDLLRNKKETLWIRMNNKEYISYTTNLYDVSKTNLGHKVFIIDISHEYNALITNIKQYGLIMIFGTIMMLFLGYRLEKFKQKKIDDTLETLENSQKKLEQAKKKAEEANNAKSDFLANMSHEIRTPMNAILGFIQLLQKHETDNEKLKKLNIIQSSGNSLLAVINDILDFSKIERGKLDVEKQNFELKKPFEESTTLLFEKASEKGINTQLYFDAQLPKFAIGDALRIKQVVSNLLNNAIKFTDSKGSISVKVDYDTSKKLIICTVEDNGIGISKDKIEYIFTSFSQADTSTTRKYGGTGLGLTISSQLIKLMGGELRVESIIGEGSSFIFSLPLFDEIELLENNEDVIDEEKMEENDAETIFEGAVLLVEDNRANQMLMGIFLDEFGLEYTIASDGIEAISTFKNNKFNIILMDENMPNMNGLEATKKIIAYEKEHNLIHTPIIAVTANALTGDRDYFTKDGGMDDYLAKPIDHKDLERILGIYLKRV